MKAFTDISQSKKLTEILPIESADMYYCYGMNIHTKVWSFDDTPTIIDNSNQIDVHADIPCWGLAALLDVLEGEIDGEMGETYQLNIEKDGTWWNVWYEEQYDEADPIETESTEDLVDACYDMIIKLNGLNLL